MTERDELDSVINAALETYVDAEARPGLAQRVFEVTSRREPRRAAVRWWAVAVPALAAAVLMAVFVAHRADSPATSPVIARVPSSTSSPALPLQPARRTYPAGRRAVTAVTNRPVPSALPRLEVFPTPSPLTAEEEALLKLGNRRLEEATAQEIPEQTVQSVPQGPIEPIHIAAIHIPPLNPPDNGSN